jgi:hypothetical protein
LNDERVGSPGGPGLSRACRPTAARLLGAGLVAAALLAGCAGFPGLEDRFRTLEETDAGILFRFRAPSARTVQILGDWPGNDLGRGEGTAGEVLVGLMSDEDGDGTWEITVDLAPGRYRYRFLVDEVFTALDPANPERVPDGSGGAYSLLVVE